MPTVSRQVPRPDNILLMRRLVALEGRRV